MAHTEALTLHIDTELKEQAANLFQELGLDLSTATGLFYRQALRRRGLPFDVCLDEPNETTYAAMRAAEAGEELYGPFDSVSELMEALDA
ncbi:MAG: type II toxin-antitoxin system RelB/DinJ family antitoxin [Selenomonas massiliensis]